MLNVNFDYYEETNGKDPDSHSPSLNQHHKILWSKRIPNGDVFDLEGKSDRGKLLLNHKSELGEFSLSSDTISHSLFYPDDDSRGFAGQTSYAKLFPSETIKREIPDVIKDFWKYEIGIACHTVFPARKVDGKHTINQARGVNHKICDRFDLTLECIRRYYENTGDMNPLYVTLKAYKPFFDLFDNFKGYVNFFFFQDLVEDDYSLTKLWLPFDDFVRSPLPQTSQEYRLYKNNVCDFITKRKQRISKTKVTGP